MEDAMALANRFREVLLDGTWIANTNYKHQLEDIDLKMAVTKVADLNTIAALTYHVNYYIQGVVHVFEGGELKIRDAFSFDMPELKHEEDWNALKADLLRNASSFAYHVSQMSEELLISHFVDKKYGSYRRNIEGMIEHAYYHLGQITLLKKLVSKYQL